MRTYQKVLLAPMYALGFVCGMLLLATHQVLEAFYWLCTRIEKLLFKQ